MEDRLLRGMAWLRAVSATIEVLAALAMFRLVRLEDAFRVNALLGLVGPTVFLLVSTLGVVGMAGQLTFGRFVLVALGCVAILLGTRSS